MIALLLTLQAVVAVPSGGAVLPAPAPAPTPVAAPALGPIGRQALPASGCAAYLWSSAGDRTLVAMAVATPPQIRLALDGAAPADLALASGEGAPSYGLAPTGTYRSGDVTATLALTVATRGDLRGGAVVQQGTLTVERPGRDALVVPVAGLIGCAS